MMDHAALKRMHRALRTHANDTAASAGILHRYGMLALAFVQGRRYRTVEGRTGPDNAPGPVRLCAELAWYGVNADLDAVVTWLAEPPVALARPASRLLPSPHVFGSAMPFSDQPLLGGE